MEKRAVPKDYLKQYLKKRQNGHIHRTSIALFHERETSFTLFKLMFIWVLLQSPNQLSASYNHLLAA